MITTYAADMNDSVYLTASYYHKISKHLWLDDITRHRVGSALGQQRYRRHRQPDYQIYYHTALA